ncbi:hypothetical protein JCM14036_28890 [Desulfotomaculum defluvii]
MAEVSLHLDRVDGANALEKIEQAMHGVGFGEELNITMDAIDAHHSDEISDFLAKKDFDFQPIGSHDGKTYKITARRKNPPNN